MSILDILECCELGIASYVMRPKHSIAAIFRVIYISMQKISIIYISISELAN